MIAIVAVTIFVYIYFLLKKKSSRDRKNILNKIVAL